MGHPLRRFDPDQIYFVTNRTLQGRLFMTPTKGIKELIGGCLAKALSRYDIEIYGYTFLSNHYHLIIKARADTLAKFMNHLNSNIAKKVSKRIGWSGKFWQRRYSAEPILDEGALIERMEYLIQHGVKEGLVNRCVQWPGLNCIESLLNQQTPQYPWLNETKLCLDGRTGGGPKPEEAYTENLPVTLSTLPCWEHLSPGEQRAEAKKLVAGAQSDALKSRRGKKALGIRRVLKQNPLSAPKSSKRSRRPLCHTTFKEIWLEFRNLYRNFVREFRHASELFREGHLKIAFPRFAYPPPLPLQLSG